MLHYVFFYHGITILWYLFIPQKNFCGGRCVKKKSRRDGRMKKESGGLVYKPEKVKMGQKEFLIC